MLWISSISRNGFIAGLWSMSVSDPTLTRLFMRGANPKTHLLLSSPPKESETYLHDDETIANSYLCDIQL